jgi:hypothetical protein
MAFSHTIGGTTFTDASFQGNAYADEAAGFPKALEKMVEHVANAYHGASTDPHTVGTGAKALTIANGNGQIPAFALGMPVRIARTSDPAGVWMQGEITDWDGATGIATINVDATKGSGSFSDWSIVIGGHLTVASGAPPLAVSQGGTGASSGKAALANLTPGFEGVIESNANFVDAVIFGPALDPVDWSPRTAAATAALMLATVETAGIGPDVVANGDFATDTDWSKGTGWVIGGGVASVDHAAAGDLSQPYTDFRIGQTYRIEYTISSYIAGSVRCILYGEGCNAVGATRTANGTYSEDITFVAGGSLNDIIKFQTISEPSEYAVDDVSVRAVGAEVNIWDTTGGALAGATPLATLVIAGAAAPTSIAARMGYIIVGHEDGITIIDPHDGAWQERTTGWPRSLSVSTNPSLNDNDVIGVAAGFSDRPLLDPRTGGDAPTFAVKFGTGSRQGCVIKDDGNVFTLISSTATAEMAIAVANGRIFLNYDASQFRRTPPISTITAAQNVNPPYLMIYSDNDPYNIAAAADKVSIHGRILALASGEGLGFNLGSEETPPGGNDANQAANASITNAFNTGYYQKYAKGLWLMNSKTEDRTPLLGNTLSELGTVTEAAVETGAELMAYSGWSASNYLKRAYDADLDFGTGDLSITWWFKSSTNNTGMWQRADAGDVGSQIRMIVNSDGTLHFFGEGVSMTTNQSLTNGFWHQVVVTRISGVGALYIDGVFEIGDAAWSNDLDNASAELWIGERIHGGPDPFTGGELTLLRFCATAPSVTQIREIYEFEKGMFVANAKCLLQGAGVAVLDVSVDPISGKVAVTQTDSAMIFNGLVVESEPVIAAGGTTWEHNLLYGDDRIEINDANLSATIAARDLREDMEILRGLKAGLPSGVDLSKLKAFAYIETTAPTLYSTMNVKGVTNVATGKVDIEFAVPFKDDSWVGIGISAKATDRFCSVNRADNTRAIARATLFRHSTSLEQDGDMMIAFFGELENE